VAQPSLSEIWHDQKREKILLTKYHYEAYIAVQYFL